jgi:hypothetical protein
LRVLLALGAFEVAGWAYFWARHDDLKPSSDLFLAYNSNDTEAREHFQPFLYALDLLLPLVSLGQRVLWIPQGVTSWVVTFLTLVGWVLGGVLAYGITTAFQRRSS